MNYQKIIDELNDLLDEQERHVEVVCAYKKRLSEKKQKLQEKLEHRNCDGSNLKLNRQLDLIRSGYELLTSSPHASNA